MFCIQNNGPTFAYRQIGSFKFYRILFINGINKKFVNNFLRINNVILKKQLNNVILRNSFLQNKKFTKIYRRLNTLYQSKSVQSLKFNEK